MAAPNWIAPEALHLVPFAASPLSLIGENVNHLYRYYSPPIVNVALLGDAGGSQVWELALPASADGIVYRCEIHAWTSTNATVTATLHEQAGASTGAWGSTIMSYTEGAAATGHRWVSNALMVATVAATTTHVKLTVSASAGDVQTHCVIIYPDAPLTLPTATTTAGFTPYKADVLESVTGAPIHREMVNRIAEGVRVVLRDRPHQILGYADTTAASTRFSSSGDSHHAVFVGGAHIPGQAGDATVRYRITDTTGSGNKVYLREVGGSNDLELTVDDTDRTATLSALGPKPEFAILAAPDSALEIKYIQAFWTPGD